MTKEEFLTYIKTCEPKKYNYKQLLSNLKLTEVDVDNDEAFIVDFQNAVLSRNSQDCSKAFLQNYRVQFCDNTNKVVVGDNDVRDISKWTIRHYSEQQFDVLFSKMSLEKKGITTKGNTAKKDWLVLGNTGNTFFVLCFDGTPLVKKGFLDNCNYYFEMELSSVQTKVWISEDLLPLNNKTPKILGGNNGVSLFNQLFEIQDLKQLRGQTFISTLSAIFNDSIEVKIPSAVQTKPETWHKIK